MAEYLIQDTTLASIANAIREKTGETGTMKPSEFFEKIGGLTIGGNTDKDPFASYTLLENPTGLPEGCMLNNFTWHPNGQHMIFVTTRGAVLYDITTEPYTYIGLIKNSNLSVPWSAVYSSDGTKLILVCGGTDTTGITIRTYDTTAIPYVPIEGVIPLAYTKSSFFGQGRYSALHPNGEILCITGEQGYVVFDTTTMPYTVLYEQRGVGQPSAPLFHPDGTKLYIFGTGAVYKNTYGTSYYVGICKIAEDKTISFTVNSGVINEKTNNIVFYGDKLIVPGDIGRQVRLYNIGSSTPILSITSLGRSAEYSCLDPTGKYLIAGGQGYNGLRAIEMGDNHCTLHSLAKEFTFKTRCVKYSPDMKRLFIAAEDNTQPLFIYDAGNS